MSNVLKCRYSKCIHGGLINKDTDEYIMHGNKMYYHKDCYELKKKGMDKDEQTKRELREFREIWYEKINRTVIWWQLNKVLEEYLERGISSEYLLFALNYVVSHNYKLNYPPGFRYYIDKEEIKKAYKIKKAREKMAPPNKPNANNDIAQAETVTFKIPKRKSLDDLFN